jgi:hypothetical protein
MGTHGTKGVRNGRATSGFVRRITMIAAHTMTNAMSVPMFTRSARSFNGKTAATSATSTPVRMVALCGVRKRGCTAAKKLFGMRPSRAIASSTRACESSSTRRTLVIPTTAPSEIRNSATGSPRALKALATGAWMSIWSYGIMPVSTAATRM